MDIIRIVIKGGSGYGLVNEAYEDKHRETVNYFCPSEFFADYFRLIKKLVPSCEYVPAVLLTQEDYEDTN